MGILRNLLDYVTDPVKAAAKEGGSPEVSPTAADAQPFSSDSWVEVPDHLWPNPGSVDQNQNSMNQSQSQNQGSIHQGPMLNIAHLVGVDAEKDYGVRQGRDSTKALNDAIAAAAEDGLPCLLTPGGRYETRGIDMSMREAKLVCYGQGRGMYAPHIRIRGFPMYVDSKGRRTGIRLQTPEADGDRVFGQVLQGFVLIDDTNKCDFGIYGRYIPWLTLKDITTWGFGTGICTTFHWNSIADGVTNFHFRERGFATFDPPFRHLQQKVNCFDIGNLHTISHKGNTPRCNVDLRCANSLRIRMLTTEGNQQNHIELSARTLSVDIGMIHAEGTGNLFMLDMEEGQPNYQFGNVNVNSGSIFHTHGKNTRVVNYRGNLRGAGLANLRLGSGLAFRIREGTSPEYFDLSYVGNIETHAKLHRGPSNLTWKNLGAKVEGKISAFGHNGLMDDPGGVYLGTLNDKA
ncbi:hypothetical protein FGL86_00920 [Pistricoccus aurantiacus]|uniref:Pectate lyase superfamily protein domain-containing protein n=1 Tax=Pistricoccus aurantiacus TaxID=1883414 RepID=A0A5B8SNX3_9GAMM|nr:hypothetical protein [Pistricoccus aurantiacus]QEA37767.1 hypothetical protein FGL86_00920 [Pistricoccus aurantiacus]